MTVDIRGLDKMDLLEKLWDNQVPAGYFRMFDAPTPMFDVDEALAELTSRGALDMGVDYICGRAIKVDLMGDDVNPRMYDRDAGEGTFARVVSNMRK